MDEIRTDGGTATQDVSSWIGDGTSKITSLIGSSKVPVVRRIGYHGWTIERDGGVQNTDISG